jgi:hypothetical protein
MQRWLRVLEVDGAEKNIYHKKNCDGSWREYFRENVGLAHTLLSTLI